MAFKARFSQKALDDIDNIIDTTHSPARRKQFKKELNDKVKQLEQFPESAPLVYKKVRVAVFLKAPFKIVYTLTRSLVYIIAIWHQKRSDRWKDRIK